MDDTKDNKKYYAPFYLDTIYSIDDFDLHIKSIDSELDKKSKAFLSAVKNSDIDVNDVDFPKNISEDVQKMGEDLF